MMSLPLVSTIDQPAPRKRGDKGHGYQPKLPRKDALRLCREVLDAACIAAAVVVLRRWAKKLPPTTPRLSRLGNEYVQPGYHETLGGLAAALALGKAAHPVIDTKGNSKLAFATFSTLPLFTCPGVGTCGQWCYSLHSWRCPGSLARQIQNTLLLRHRPDLVRSSFLKLPAGISLRLYVDGDFTDAKTVAFWMDLLRQRPDIQAYGYSKSWDELWAFHEQERGIWPPNYWVNLSSGSRVRKVTADMIRSLPVYRGDFTAVETNYRPIGLKGNIGNLRYKDPAYHRAVRKAAREAGITGKIFSCPGKCHECTPHGHACGTERFKGITVVNGMH